MFKDTSESTASGVCNMMPLTSTRAVHPPSSPSTSIAPARPRPRPLHQKPNPQPTLDVPINVADSDESDLTPLASPIENKGNLKDTRMSPVTKTTMSTPKRAPQFDLDAWDIRKLGGYVWVLVDRRGRVLDLKNSSSPAPEQIWWPGKVLQVHFLVTSAC